MLMRKIRESGEPYWIHDARVQQWDDLRLVFSEPEAIHLTNSDGESIRLSKERIRELVPILQDFEAGRGL